MKIEREKNCAHWNVKNKCKLKLENGKFYRNNGKDKNGWKEPITDLSGKINPNYSKIKLNIFLFIAVVIVVLNNLSIEWVVMTIFGTIFFS